MVANTLSEAFRGEVRDRSDDTLRRIKAALARTLRQEPPAGWENEELQHQGKEDSEGSDRVVTTPRAQLFAEATPPPPSFGAPGGRFGDLALPPPSVGAPGGRFGDLALPPSPLSAAPPKRASNPSEATGETPIPNHVAHMLRTVVVNLPGPCRAARSASTEAREAEPRPPEASVARAAALAEASEGRAELSEDDAPREAPPPRWRRKPALDCGLNERVRRRHEAAKMRREASDLAAEGIAQGADCGTHGRIGGAAPAAPAVPRKGGAGARGGGGALRGIGSSLSACGGGQLGEPGDSPGWRPRFSKARSTSPAPVLIRVSSRGVTPHGRRRAGDGAPAESLRSAPAESLRSAVSRMRSPSRSLSPCDSPDETAQGQRRPNAFALPGHRGVATPERPPGGHHAASAEVASPRSGQAAHNVAHPHGATEDGVWVLDHYEWQAVPNPAHPFWRGGGSGGMGACASAPVSVPAQARRPLLVGHALPPPPPVLPVPRSPSPTRATVPMARRGGWFAMPGCEQPRPPSPMRMAEAVAAARAVSPTPLPRSLSPCRQQLFVGAPPAVAPTWPTRTVVQPTSRQPSPARHLRPLGHAMLPTPAAPPMGGGQLLFQAYPPAAPLNRSCSLQDYVREFPGCDIHARPIGTAFFSPGGT